MSCSYKKAAADNALQTFCLYWLRTLNTVFILALEIHENGWYKQMDNGTSCTTVADRLCAVQPPPGEGLVGTDLSQVPWCGGGQCAADKPRGDEGPHPAAWRLLHESLQSSSSFSPRRSIDNNAQRSVQPPQGKGADWCPERPTCVCHHFLMLA